MSPLILIIGAVTFLACFTVHVVWWRCKKHPKSDILALTMVFFVIPATFAVFAYILHVSFINLFSVGLLHIALSSAYIMSYPAVQAKCPSLNILLIVNNAMPRGITKEEIKQALGDDSILDISVQKMIEEGLAKEENNLIISTKLGNKIALIFIIYRSILGIGQGEG